MRKTDYGIIKAELKEEPLHTLNIAFALMSVIPLLAVIYLINEKFRTYGFLTGLNGFLFLVCIILSLSGFLVAYLLLKKIIDKMLQYCEDRRQAEELKSALIEEVSRDFHAPIDTMKNNLENCKNESAIDALISDQRKSTYICDKALEKLTQLVNFLLDLSRIKIARVGAKRELLDLSSIMEDEIGMARPMASLVNKPIFYSRESRSLKIWGNKEKIRKALFNSLHNIIEQTPPGGQIQVSLTTEEETIKLTFSNTETNIKKDDMGKIFDRFSYIKKYPHNGRDADLSLAKEVVEFHKGKMDVFNMPDRGIQFRIFLPRDLRAG